MIAQVSTLLLTLAYPMLVFFAITFWNIQGLGIILLLLGVIRITQVLLQRERLPANTTLGGLQGAALILFSVAILATHIELPARLYPVVVNAGLLGWFGWSLLNPPSIVERIARVKESSLPKQAIAYTRRVTVVWCVFFACNGSIALYTSLFSSLETWMIYNGLIAYLLMGSLFGVEYLFRQKVRSDSGAVS